MDESDLPLDADDIVPLDQDAEPREPTQPVVSPQKGDGVLYVGIDLGTSRTAVAASNGVRESVASFVGYPKDVVSRKALQKDVLYGDEALRNRLSLNLYRPLEKGVIQFSGDDPDSREAKEFHRAAADLVQHAVSLAKPRTDELVYAVIGCPAEASIKNKKAILESARSVVDSCMICSEPFAVAYGLDLFQDVLVIDIGAGTTDLCRMHGTLPSHEDQLTLDYAGDHIDRTLFEELKKSCTDAQFTIHGVQKIKERYAYVGESRDPIYVDLPVKGKPTKFEVNDAIRTACRSIIPPIVESLGELVASFDPDFQSRLKNNVLMGGGGSQIVGLGEAIEKQMIETLGEGHVKTVEEPVYAGANGALKTAHDMPPEFWEQLK
jgi:rod shape-determining protein MreB